MSNTWKTATEELSLGFLEGPFLSEDAAIRRLVLVQGAESKLRPIMALKIAAFGWYLSLSPGAEPCWKVLGFVQV